MADHLSFSSSQRPLVVDLDGTLCHTDTLYECFFEAWRKKPWLPLLLVLWLLRGRAHMKARLASLALPQIDALPWNKLVIDALATARHSGRVTALATAANEQIALAISAQLGGFDYVLASSATENLKGRAKADRLIALFGDHGFDYIGDSSADLPVWACAVERISVGSIVPQGGYRLGNDARSSWRRWTKLLRVRHWIKNLLVFVAPLAGHQWSSGAGWSSTVAAFLAFCAVCSAIYVVNDLLDLSADRSHPTKRNRPLAAGTIALQSGLRGAIVLGVLGTVLALAAGPRTFAVIMLYVALNVIYSGVGKRIPIFDVFCLATMYTLRVVAGATAASVTLSPWLAGFSAFTFLSLALLKRAADLRRLVDDDVLSGRGYRGRDLAFVSQLGVCTAIAAALVLTLYVSSDQVASLYAEPMWLWGAVVVVLYWLTRMWYLTSVGTMDDDPVLFATSDTTSYLCAAATLMFVVCAV